MRGCLLKYSSDGRWTGGSGGACPPRCWENFSQKVFKKCQKSHRLKQKVTFFQFFSLQNRYFSSISVKSRPCYSMSVILTDIVFFHSSNSKITIISHFPEISRVRVYIACHDVIDPTFIFFHQNRYFSSISIKSRNCSGGGVW